MAIRQVSKAGSSARQWNSKTFFPKDNYAVRCIGEEVAPNSKGNNMVTLEWEIINAASQLIGDEMVEFDGVTFKTYHVIKVVNAEDKTQEEIAGASQNAFDNYAKILTKAGYQVEEGYDDENPPKMKGKVMYASLYSKQDITRKMPTAEQKAKNAPGDVVKDPITGKEMISYWPQLSEILGQVPESAINSSGATSGSATRPF